MFSSHNFPKFNLKFSMFFLTDQYYSSKPYYEYLTNLPIIACHKFLNLCNCQITQLIEHLPIRWNHSWSKYIHRFLKQNKKVELCLTGMVVIFITFFVATSDTCFRMRNIRCQIPLDCVAAARHNSFTSDLFLNFKSKKATKIWEW